MPEFIQNSTTEINISVQDIIDLLIAKYPGKLVGRNIVSGNVFVPDTDYDAADDATKRYAIKPNTLLTVKVTSDKIEVPNTTGLLFAHTSSDKR